MFQTPSERGGIVLPFGRVTVASLSLFQTPSERGGIVLLWDSVSFRVRFMEFQTPSERGGIVLHPRV